MGPGFFYYHRGPDRRQVRKALIFLAVSGLLAFLLYAGAQLRPLLGSLATTRVSNAVNRIVYQAVNEAIDSGQIAYEELVRYEKDNEGRITMVRSNMAAFNILRIDVYVSILLPGYSTVTQVSNEITVAETVIVGAVPETYTYFSTTPDVYEDDAKDYILNKD